MARPVERQPAYSIDIIFQFAHAFAGVRVDPGQILRIIAGKDQAFRPNPLKRAIERDNAALEACHIEIDAIVIVGEWFLQRAETVTLTNQSIFDGGDAAAEMSDNDLKIWETIENTAGDQSRRCHREVDLAAEHARQIVIF